jgi:hypothetical protein
MYNLDLENKKITTGIKRLERKKVTIKTRMEKNFGMISNKKRMMENSLQRYVCLVLWQFM